MVQEVLIGPNVNGWGANMNCSRARGFLLLVASLILASTNMASAQIVALGHSAVRGHIGESEMWPAVLESMLRARGSRVHVINAGINGETTAEELLGDPRGMQRRGTPERDQRARAKVLPALDCVHPCGIRHVLVHDLADPQCGMLGGEVLGSPGKAAVAHSL